MRVNIPTIILAPLLLASGTQGHLTMWLYQDNDCQIPVPGTGQTKVNSGTCDTNVQTGWSSAKIITNFESPGGIVTFYNRNNCAPAQKSRGFLAIDGGCLRNFGFVANAVGLLG